MRTTQIQVYKFKDLKTDIQEKVLNRFREKNDYPFLENDLTEYLKEILNENGIKVNDLKIEYDLSYRQGSGFCFYGDFEYKGYNFRIKKSNSHYSHKYTTDIYLSELENLTDLDNYDKLTELVLNKLEENFKELYLNICDKLEKQGYAEIEYIDSDDYIKENIEINEYEFLENGEFF